jgi:hypothetical protein
MSNEYSPADEFRALRAELEQGKEYIFERPLLLITVSIALLNFIEKPYVSLLPPIVIGLLMFNLWFTVNRTRSGARIVAYIQLVLEEKSFKPWLGWETSLRHYRRWMKLNKPNVRKIIDSELDREVIPDVTGYYPTLYTMHVIVVVTAMFGAIVYTFINPGVTNLIPTMITFLIFLGFLAQAIKYYPGIVSHDKLIP